MTLHTQGHRICADIDHNNPFGQAATPSTQSGVLSGGERVPVIETHSDDSFGTGGAFSHPYRLSVDSTNRAWLYCCPRSSDQSDPTSSPSGRAISCPLTAEVGSWPPVVAQEAGCESGACAAGFVVGATPWLDAVGHVVVGDAGVEVA